MSLVAAIDDALRLSDRDSQVTAVHDVVRNGLREIAPNLDIRTTDYFTHTFIPDLILSWGSGDRRQERPVHLRFVISDEAFLSEVDFLAGTGPMFLGLVDAEPIIDLASGNGAADRRAGTLVTQSAALEALQAGRARDQRTVTASREVVRGGHGALGAVRATELLDAYHDSLQAIERMDKDEEAASGTTRHALAVLKAVLRTRDLATIERDLRSRWISRGGDPFSFPGVTDWDPQALTHDELGEILNALLDSQREIPLEVWSRNAWFLSAQELAEALGRDRRGGSLNQLATALLQNWTAQWVWAETLAPRLEPSYDWLIQDKTLAIELGDMRAAFRDDGRRFKDKQPTDDPLPSVADMEEVLRDPYVQAATFHTAAEDISYAYRARAGETLYDRILQVFEPSQLKMLRVSEVRTLVPGRDDVAEIDLDRQVIDLDKTPTPISILVRLAMSYFHLAHYKSADVDYFLRTGEQPSADGIP